MITKRIWTTFLVMVLLWPAVAMAGALQYKLRVDGLACPFCAYGIEKKLKHTQGVKGVAVDINAGIVMVTMADGATMTKDQAHRIVKDAGFTLRGFEQANSVITSDQ